jgi:hypothetical protein
MIRHNFKKFDILLDLNQKLNYHKECKIQEIIICHAECDILVENIIYVLSVDNKSVSQQ